MCIKNEIDICNWGKFQGFNYSKTRFFGCSGTTHTNIHERTKIIIESLSQGIIPEFFPAQMQINLTSICQRKKNYQGDCINCSFPLDDSVFIEPNRLIETLKIFAKYGGQSIFLSGGGEPGVYKHLDLLLRFLADDPLGQKLELTLNTNGAYVHRILHFLKHSESKSAKWKQRLQRIYSSNRGGRNVLSTISISWHDDKQGIEAVNLLASLRKDLGLYFVIRISSLVYSESQINIDNIKNFQKQKVGGEYFSMTTSVSQAKAIANLAAKYGADIICYKPAHINKKEIRQTVQNQAVYDYVVSQVEYQKCIAIKNNWDWDKCQNLNEFNIIFEQSDRLNRLKNNYKMAISVLEKHNLSYCIAPIAMIFLTPYGFALCCDTWDDGIGSSKTIISNTITTPSSYYKNALNYTLKNFHQLWPKNCVIGCGWTELNLNNKLSKELKFYNLNCEIKSNISSIFNSPSKN
jgi:hypothetical protein